MRSAVRVVVTVLGTMIVRVVVTVPGAAVVRMIVPVPSANGAFHRLKNLVLQFKCHPHAGEQLPHCWVVADADFTRSNLHRHVKVANLPAGLGRLDGVAGQADGDHPLWRLPDAIAMAFRLEKNRVMLERLGQLEAEVGAVLRLATPTAFLQLEPIGNKLNLGQPSCT